MTDEIKRKRLITSALPYVNNLPHLGNIIGSLLSADVFNRYCKIRGYESTFVCGTDEYGTASEVAADKLEIQPGELCAMNSAKHKEIYDWFKIECDMFGRTTSSTHTELVQKLFLEMWHNGCFVEKTEERYFCEECHMFLADRYVSGTCSLCNSDQARGDQCDGCGRMLQPANIINPKCSVCQSTPDKRPTKHLFYSLEKFQERISQCIDENVSNWTPAARQVALEWKSKELHSRCITRDLKYNWGIPVPLPEYEGKVLYVWFDAPIGYMSFCEDIGKLSLWSDPNTDLYEFMGKDNVFFHSVFFPALLMGTATRYNYPKMISSTHYLKYEDGKFSKSQGRGIFGSNLVHNQLGPEGIWRFHLIRTRPETDDFDFTWDSFHTSLNGILINTIGNFCNRALSFINNKLEKTITSIEIPQEIQQKLSTVLTEYISHMEATEMRAAVEKIIEVATLGNGYIQQVFTEKASQEKVRERMSSCINIILLLARMLYPITPTESLALYQILNLPANITLPEVFSLEISLGHTINQPTLIFKPLTNDEIKEVMKLCTKECPFKINPRAK
ncbi:methionyl-tRNA synthetase [Nematocida sp. AWRm80]|nr:methionyl-tRNA synthetase [Nematocida sp. AWRm80]